MKHSVVTTFNQRGYDEYGANCVSSFLKYWPREVHLHIVSEDVNLSLPADRVTVHSQPQSLIDFKNAYRDNEFATGRDPHGQNKTKSYRWDAVRFSNKVFAIADISRKIMGLDQLIWLDADTVTHSAIPLEFIDSVAPIGNQLTAYLNRSIYPECGWVGYNMQHPIISRFMDQFENTYTSGKFLSYEESHDSFIFWKIMDDMVNFGVEWRPLGDSTQSNHVFINSEFGKYMDHLKGPRKALGKSKSSDLLVNRTEDWWKDIR